MSTILDETKNIMKQFHIRANKSLGQNFLVSEQVVEAIVDSSCIGKQDFVIEIGPGLGTLTKFLIQKAGKVLAVELDRKMISILENRFANCDNFSLLNQDILKVDLKKIIEEEKAKGKIQNVKIVANLPYYITTPIIMKLLEDKLPLESITVMIQKEVADRLIAIPGDKETGAITYRVYYYAEAEAIMEVPKESFIPEPEVTSKVIKLNIRKEPAVKIEEEEVLFRIIKCAFLQRRKTLLNALVNAKVFLNKEEGVKILEEIGLEQDVRAEKLRLEDYAKITKLIIDKITK